MPFKNSWAAPASSGTPAPRVNGSATDATWWNYIGDDIRAWGGNVSAEGHSLVNVGTVAATKGGFGIASPQEKVEVNGAVRVFSNVESSQASSGAMDYYAGMRLLSYGPDAATPGDFNILQASANASTVRLLLSANSAGHLTLNLSGYASDGAAGTGGLTAGQLYYNTSTNVVARKA